MIDLWKDYYIVNPHRIIDIRLDSPGAGGREYLQVTIIVTLDWQGSKPVERKSPTMSRNDAVRIIAQIRQQMQLTPVAR